MKVLSKTEFLATLASPITFLESNSEAPFDFWVYFDAIPSADFRGYDCSAGAVPHVSQNPNGSYQHVYVASEDKNVSMVLVLDMSKRRVLGQRLLDLNREHGLVGRLIKQRNQQL
jgi:hypothetical protein